MKRLRIYCDTSVFGGCFDEEFKIESKKLFSYIKNGRFILVVSDTLLAELDKAPKKIQKILSELSEANVEFTEFSDEVSYLRDRYIEAGVISKANRLDAEHIAFASVADVDFVVSWNFKHIVNYNRINGYQAVNLLSGYKEIKIYSPKEIVEDD